MGNRRYSERLITETDFANQARSYRLLAATMPDGPSRHRLLRMAQAMEDKSTGEDAATATIGT